MGRLDAMTLKFVSVFDNFLPKHAGALPYNFCDFMFVCTYFMAILYVLLRIIKAVYKASMTLFCFFCCCGCMCKSRTKTTKDDVQKAKVKKDAQTAAKHAAKPEQHSDAK